MPPEPWHRDPVPKHVDHGARRTQIAEALLRVAAREGLGSVSLRHVAAEAGVSMGLVQHYFRTKDEMMTFALGVVSENVQRRLAEQALDPGEDPRAVVRALLHQMLPIDEERRREGHAALYAAYTAVRPDAAHEVRAQMDQLREYVAVTARAAGRTEDPETAAATLLALTDGLMLHVLGGVVTPGEAQHALDTQITAILGPT